MWLSANRRLVFFALAGASLALVYAYSGSVTNGNPPALDSATSEIDGGGSSVADSTSDLSDSALAASDSVLGATDTGSDAGISLPPDDAAISADDASCADSMIAAFVVTGPYSSHTCAVSLDGRLRCWGDNSSGQLGLGTTGAGTDAGLFPTTVDLGAGRTATALGVGSQHTCAVLDDGSVTCWGSNSCGQLGNATTDNNGATKQYDTNKPGAPIDLGGGHTAKALSAGTAHSCALLDDDSVKCWGQNAYGQLGVGTTGNATNTDVPTTAVDLGVGRSAKAISAGNTHTCAILDDSSMRCWGRNASGELGVGNTTDTGTPGVVNLGLGRSARMIAAGAGHTCALLDDASVKCWGGSYAGELGLGNAAPDTNAPTTAVDLGAGRSATAISVGGYHSCALLDDGTIKCWGQNDQGQIGVGDTMNRTTPTALYFGAGRTGKAITNGVLHGCATLDNSCVRCWGRDTEGELGIGRLPGNVSTSPAAPVVFGF